MLSLSETARVGGSFRDPAGRLIDADGRLLRLVHPDGVAPLQAFLRSASGRAFMETKRVIATSVLETTDAGLMLEHERVPFASFPYEWPPEMLQAAGRLTLELAESLLAEGLGLKDATPYNVLFRGAEAVFVDVLSVEQRQSGDATWLAYAQFVRTFVLPLLAHRRFGIPLDQLLLSRRDGLQPEEVYRLCGPLQRLLPPWLTLASIPTWLGARQNADDAKLYHRTTVGDPAQARFILRSLFKGLRRRLDQAVPARPPRSAWSEYLTSQTHYTPTQLEAKRAFVNDALTEFHPARVLDVGCNTGSFSELAAATGARVVAIDTDPVVVGRLWCTAHAKQLDILPLVVDVARPTPAVGWRNDECPSFLARARGSFDGVLMLAVAHHLLVSERIPLPAIIELAAELTTDWLVIEFVAPEDPMFRRLTRGREALFTMLTPQVFETACRAHFEILRTRHLEGTSRWLYLMRRTGAAHATV